MPKLLRRLRRVWRAGMLRLAIEGEIGDRITALGERLGSRRLVYNPWTFAIFHRAALEIAPSLVEAVRIHLPEVESVVDFGCGTGVYVAELRRHRLTAVGYEHAPLARRWALSRMGMEIEPFDLQTFAGGGRTFDLALSLEVAEHLEPELALKLVDVCCAHAPIVLFSAAPPGQHGHGHINPQPKKYWVQRFVERSFVLDEGRTAAVVDHLRTRLERGFWIADNLGIYVRAPYAG
jgi:SAM-dependent methyltransferase